MMTDGRRAGRARWRSGVTLVELLTSLMVASIIMVALLQALVSTSDSWTRQSKHFSAQREGRVAMRMLADDLAAAVPVPEWARRAVAVEGRAGEGGVEGAPVVDPRTGFWLGTAAGALESARLVFLRATGPEEGEAGRGDLRLVMYGVAMSRDGGASGLAPDAASQKLVRREFSAEETFRRLRQLMESRRPLVGEGDWEALSEWRDDAAVATTGVVAHDVVRFEARPFTDLQAPRAVFAEPAWALPRWLDVTLRVTNRQTGQMLRTAPDWKGAGEKAAALLNGTPEVYDDDAEVKTYTLRLRMPTPAT